MAEATAWTGSAEKMREQECNAVKPGVSGLLDAARAVHAQSVDDIHALVEEYREAWQLPGAAPALRHNGSRGYHLHMPSAVTTLPEECMQASKNRAGVVCSTEELIALNDRCNQALMEVYRLTNVSLMQLMDELRGSIDRLYAMAEAVALLDVLLSFAALVAASDGAYCKPEMRSSGGITIVNGRHPVIEKLSTTPFVANTLHLGPLSNLLLITGANCTGKSTLLKQTALITILAHIGSFVPADSATVLTVDAIFTRIGTSDNMEANASTFTCECVLARHPWRVERTASRAFAGCRRRRASWSTPRRAAWPSSTSSGAGARRCGAGGECRHPALTRARRSTAYQDGLAIAWATAESLALERWQNCKWR